MECFSLNYSNMNESLTWECVSPNWSDALERRRLTVLELQKHVSVADSSFSPRWWSLAGVQTLTCRETNTRQQQSNVSCHRTALGINYCHFVWSKYNIISRSPHFCQWRNTPVLTYLIFECYFNQPARHVSLQTPPQVEFSTCGKQGSNPSLHYRLNRLLIPIPIDSRKLGGLVAEVQCECRMSGPSPKQLAAGEDTAERRSRCWEDGELG